MRRIAPLLVAAVLLACERTGDRFASSRFDERLCEPSLPDVRYGYTDADAPLPAHFVASTAGTVVFSDNTPADNRITNAGATLGRVLFYDVRLSANRSTACASCHRQEFGFGDTVRFSPGLHGDHEARRTLALANARFNPDGRFFWDERAPTLESQVLVPIQDSVEMGMPLDSLEARLAATRFYPGLFAAAFGAPEITADRVALALAQFVRSLVSARSRYDYVFATGGAPDIARLTDSEREGLALFNSVGCVNCHRTIAQFADRANNTGLDASPVDTGAGNGRFKPASLRNVAVRPPYMHDGRFASLREVVEFYDHGVHDTPDLDPRLRDLDGTPRRLELSDDQVDALVDFLGALTDSTFLHAEKFSNPFPATCGAR